MGFYEGQREQPCPRCGGVVATLFISIGSMSFSQRCRLCGASDFTDEETNRLGRNMTPKAGCCHVAVNRHRRRSRRGSIRA